MISEEHIEAFLKQLTFPSGGLLPAIAQQYDSGEVLMLAWVNEEAVRKTLETGDAHYWSRSRNELWHKGATSGHTQKLQELRFDCDADAILFLIDQIGPACHTNRISCFYNRLSEQGIDIISEPIR